MVGRLEEEQYAAVIPASVVNSLVGDPIHSRTHPLQILLPPFVPVCPNQPQRLVDENGIESRQRTELVSELTHSIVRFERTNQLTSHPAHVDVDGNRNLADTV